ncbi:MAG: copper chaperone CopZ [Synergistaceae bacterium]|jgi:copper chaperone|nr:copper chaperone CopZ [Synergistaceae bacterium]
MESVTLNVDGMSCEHCVKAVKGAVGALLGVSGVDVSLEKNTVAVTFDPGKVTIGKITSEIEDQGYDVRK